MNTHAASHCFHCGEAIPPGVRIMARLSPPQPMCCAGCAAVAELIHGQGLSDYYRYRQQPGNKPVETIDRWQHYADPDVANSFVNTTEQESNVTLLIGDLRCAACTWLIERRLRDLPGLISVHVNLVSQRARIHWQAAQLTLADVLRAIAELGYRPQPLNLAQASDTTQQRHQQEQRDLLKRLGVAALGMMQVMMYALPLYARERSQMDADVATLLSLINLLITTPVLCYAGWPFLRSAARAVGQRHINMDVPVALALLLAYGASVFNLFHNGGETWFDSITMFIFLLTLGRYVELRVRHKTGNLTDALTRMQPDIAHRLNNQGHNQHWQDVPVAQLKVNDQILVRNGEALPADGVLLEQRSSLNEALLTGESRPVNKQAGDALLAGSLNASAPLRMRVSAVGAHTVLSSVARLVEAAQFDKPRVVQQADRVARVFLQIMLCLCVITGLFWYVIDSSRALDAMLAVLVVTCPCALSLATPTAIAASIAAFAKRGLLVTRGDAIERLAQVQAIWFDKTGTLTQGRMKVTSIETRAAFTAEHALSVAAALEAGAHHPVADALRRHARLLNVPDMQATGLHVMPSQGVQGNINGHCYRLGTQSFVASLHGKADATSTQDGATIVLGDAQQPLALFQVRDALRDDALPCVRRLQQQGLDVVLLSGDAHAPVMQVASQLGIANAKARQTPASKLQALQHSNARIAMVGDGVNDAPVLAAAHVSLAMGQGAALAQASADVLVMTPRLSVIADALPLARKAQRIMRQNLIWAAAYNLCAVPLAAAGFITPWLAAAGMSLSSVLVTLNAARIISADNTQPATNHLSSTMPSQTSGAMENPA